jgi:hypothetical protein
MSKSCQKVVKTLSGSCQKVVEKLSKSCQEVVKKCQKVVKVVKTFSKILSQLIKAKTKGRPEKNWKHTRKKKKKKIIGIP